MLKWDDFTTEDQRFLVDIYRGKWKIDLRKARAEKFKGWIVVKVSEWISQRPDVQLTAHAKAVIDAQPQQVPADTATPAADAGAASNAWKLPSDMVTQEVKAVLDSQQARIAVLTAALEHVETNLDAIQDYVFAPDALSVNAENMTTDERVSGMVSQAMDGLQVIEDVLAATSKPADSAEGAGE
jgi:hypothetical protein